MRAICVWLVLATTPWTLHAQAGRFPPDTLRNVRVLPAGITPRDLINTMRGFTEALGVRCPYCHVGVEGQPLSQFDFPADEKATKATARVMIQMVQAVNAQHLGQIAQRQEPPVAVTCMTCHHGVAVPRPLADIIAATAQSSGLDSAVRAYRSMRERYFGRSAYDFGESALIGATDALAQARRFDEALGLLRLNLEFYPRSSQTQLSMGEVFRVKGDTVAAIAAYRQALALNSEEVGARQRLRQLGQQP